MTDKQKEQTTEGKKEETAAELAEAPKEEAKAEETPTKEGKRSQPTTDQPKAEKKKPEPSGKFKELIKQIESLSAIELAELVKELEERFGVSAAAPVAVAGGAPAADSTAAEPEEKSTYTVILTASGDQKINVIKALREINPELGLKEAKDLADSPPKEIKKDIPKEEAHEAKKKIEEAGGSIELK